MRVGRKPMKSGHVDGLRGARREKGRLRAILDTLSGELTIEAACARVRLSRSHFYELRERALQAALEGLEPGVPGRPPRVVEVEEGEHERLEREVEWLREELEIARVRTELALVLPGVLRDPVPAKGRSGKPRARVRRSSGRSGQGRSGTTRGSAR